MGVPLQGQFDLAASTPIDSRMTWSGTAANLNQIAANGANRYPGLITYVTGDKNLYVYQGNNIWEKIVTTNVDNPPTIVGNFNITNDYNGQVIYVNNPNLCTGTLVSIPTSLDSGFNVSIVQLGVGQVFLTGSNLNLRNRLNFNRTAGQYAVVSILRINNTNEFLLYGDVV
jgi:hypothetical protein